MRINLFLDITHGTQGEYHCARLIKDFDSDLRPMVGDTVVDEGLDGADVTKVTLDYANEVCAVYLNGPTIDSEDLSSCIDDLVKSGWYLIFNKPTEHIE